MVVAGVPSPITSATPATPITPDQPVDTPSSATHPGYPTDGLCARPLVRLIVDDYLQLVYPLVPVVHRPSFRAALAADHDLESPVFASLLLAVCAVTVGLLPSRFASCYCTWRSPGPPLRFTGREAMMNYCYDGVLRRRGPRYFDEIDFAKLAISYLLSITFFQIGDQNRARMMEVEAMQLGRLLQVHKIHEYAGLSCIEAQLRKKGFWLLFYAYVHAELQNFRKERLSFLDAGQLATLDLEALLPLDVDDEQIVADGVLPSSPTRAEGEPCLTTAFIVHSRVFWAALRAGRETPGDAMAEPPCVCRPWRNRSAHAVHLRARLHELTYMLDVLPAQLRPWAVTDTEHSDNLLDRQFAALRANLHVTHLWLQSIILDQIDLLDQDGPAHTHWPQREDICRQLLHLLHAIPERDLEPNGLHLAFKVRDVAVGLLDDGEQTTSGDGTVDSARATRSAAYIQQLTRILARLDRSEQAAIVNLQSWVDTGRVRS